MNHVRHGAARSHHGAPERLLGHTRRRLALFLMALVTALLVGVGTVTAVVSTRLLDESVSQALEQRLTLALADVELEDHDSAPQPVPAGWDSLVLVLDRSGAILPGQPDPRMAGLPDRDAVRAATSGGTDEREVTIDGEPLLVRTRAVTFPGHDDDPAVAGFAQAVQRLSLHVRQETLLLWTIAIVCGVGLIGAGVVTVLVTRRALRPIRDAFQTERRFVATASHELRTPVAIIRASAEILERERLVGDEGRSFVTDIIAEADRTGLLVADLLTLASAEAGALPVRRSPVELAGWLRSVVGRTETMAASAGLHMVADLPAGAAAVVEADADRLDQLVLILVDNAIEHSPPGGTVRLGLISGDRWATLVVEDQGPGVPVADRERIFEPFARLAGRRRTASGSGLGLAIARQLAERHGAQLTVTDAVGGGARFLLRMPLASGGMASRATSEAREAHG